MIPSAVLLGLWTATEPAPAPAPAPAAAPTVSAAARLMAELTPHDRLAVGCVGPALDTVDALAEAVSGGLALQGAGPLPATWTAAVADAGPRPSDGLVWMRLGDDPLVGAQSKGSPPPLALGDRWTDHWTDSPRIRVRQDQAVLITPHGRTPAPGQTGPEAALAEGALPDRGCVAWSKLPDRKARLVERLVVQDAEGATLRIVAPSARAADALPRVQTWAFTPASRRRPGAVMVVYTAPHVVAGAPWLQETDLPARMSSLSTLIPTGYTAGPGQVRAWFDDVVGAAMAVVIPITDAAGRPAEVTSLLMDVRERYGLPGEVEPEGRGGHIGPAGGVAIGALPGALLLSTDPEILVDMLHGRGTEWARPPTHTTAAAAWWLAPRADRPAVGGRLSIEDRMWRMDAQGGLSALEAAAAWAGI